MGCAVNNSTFPEAKRVEILPFGVATGLLNLQRNTVLVRLLGKMQHCQETLGGLW